MKAGICMKLAIAPLFLTHIKDKSIDENLQEIVDRTVFELRNDGMIVSQLYANDDYKKALLAEESKADFLVGVTFEESGQPRDNYGVRLYTNINGGLAELGAGYIGRELIQCHYAYDKGWTRGCYRGVKETPVNYRHARFLRQAHIPSVAVVLGHANNSLDRYFYNKYSLEVASALKFGIEKYRDSFLRKNIQESDPKVVKHDII